jgi:hypothetical protein
LVEIIPRNIVFVRGQTTQSTIDIALGPGRICKELSHCGLQLIELPFRDCPHGILDLIVARFATVGPHGRNGKHCIHYSKGRRCVVEEVSYLAGGSFRRWRLDFLSCGIVSPRTGGADDSEERDGLLNLFILLDVLVFFEE